MPNTERPNNWSRVLATALLIATVTQVQGQRGAPPTRGFGFQPPLGTTPKPAVPNAKKPVRSCESLAMVALPNTTLQSAAVDPANPGICRITAITTHTPAGDKITMVNRAEGKCQALCKR